MRSADIVINPQDYDTAEETRAYIEACESEFDAQLGRAAETVLSSGARTVTLSGPSCSGKTTTASRLCEALTESGRTVHAVSIDDFYRDRDHAAMKITKSGELKPDYESIASIDTDAFSDFARRLGDGGAIDVPRFDFHSGVRSGTRRIFVGDGDIVILEGIQAVYPEIVSMLDGGRNVSVHVSVASALRVGGVEFAPHDIRLMRRLVRDYNYRSASPETTFYLWDEVRENELLNIEPFAELCRVKIDSLLPYELGVIRPFLRGVLSRLSVGSKYDEAAEAALSSLRGVREITPEYVPERSVFREFISIGD